MSRSPSSDSHRPDPPRRQGWFGHLLLLAFLAGLFVLPFTGSGRRLKQGAIEVIQAARGPGPAAAPAATTTVSPPAQPAAPEIVIQEKIVYRDPPPPPLPDTFVERKSVAVAEMFNGIDIQTKVQSREGGLASAERGKDAAYQVTFSVNLTVPKANDSLDGLASLNPHLPKALPGLAAMMPAAEVSGFYHHLYDLKQKAVEKNITHLDKALSRHNFFDCETVLELRHPSTGRKVLLLQGEMDVVADGSDGDRMSEFDDYVFASSHFQGTTSYSWKKRSDRPNPLIPKYEARIAETRKKLATATGAAQKKSLQGDIDYFKKMIASLKSTSFLIASEDPFIVLPLSMRGYAGVAEFAPQLGDYAVVVSGNRLLPAIIGDYGPREKVGEASLRIAKEVNPKATPYARPESDLEVSYFIFPGSADKPFGPPDYDRWMERVGQLLTEVGGVGEGYALHRWEDRLKPKEVVPPVPDPPVASAEAGAVGASDGANGAAAAAAEEPPAPDAATPDETRPASAPAPEVR